MKKYIFICLAACIGLIGCEKDNGNEMLPSYFHNSKFFFMVCDAEGNCVFDCDDFDMEELTLEYKGQIFTPILGVDQVIGDVKTAEGGCSVIRFEPLQRDGVIAWRIFGDAMWGESVRYILRYKDNEWVCDYSSEEVRYDGSVPDDELYVNGEKVEEIYGYTLPDHPDWERSEEERMVWVYPLYVK